MAMPAGAKRGRRRRLDEDGEEDIVDRISGLPDGILGDIVSLLPTKDGARTQVLSSRWRPIWRSAPLNLDLQDAYANATGKRIRTNDVSRILSAHQGPGRRFRTPRDYLNPSQRCEALDRWLRSPALDNLQELEFHLGIIYQETPPPPPPLPASVHRISSTLRTASFGGCGFPEGNGASPVHLPLLKQLSLLDVRVSETSLNALLAACPALQSLLLNNKIGCSRVHIVSQSLRSIGLQCSYNAHTKLQQLIIQDAPCLERLFCLEAGYTIAVSVVSAPKLHVLACTSNPDNIGNTTFQFGCIVFQRSCILSSTTVVHSMKVLALIQEDLCLDMVINLLNCFPCLEKLYIRTQKAGKKNTWCHRYKNLIGTLEIRLKKIVLTDYRGNTSHVNFAKFFVLNARMLQSMRLELFDRNPNSAWIERQHGLLQIKKASRDIQVDFVAKNYCPLSVVSAELVHDLSTADPFAKLHNWTIPYNDHKTPLL